jgi:hypothetical protein
VGVSIATGSAATASNRSASYQRRVPSRGYGVGWMRVGELDDPQHVWVADLSPLKRLIVALPCSGVYSPRKTCFATAIADIAFGHPA